jgi:alcohol dehydrogenase, propanol-preferring
LRALQLTRHGAGPVLASPSDPVPAPGQVLVEVSYCAVAVGEHLVSSGARQQYTGTVESFTYPHTLGFQGVGSIVDVGAGVSRERLGEYVTVNGVLGCGECEQCRRGAENRCHEHALLGLDSGYPGCMAELVSVPERNAHPWPRRLHASLAPFVSELATMAHVIRRIECGPGDTVAVMGAGQTGLFGVAAARIAGADRVISIDANQERLDFARQLGADTTVDVREVDPVSAVRELTGEGVSRTIEVVGSTQTVAQTVRMLAPRGIGALVGTQPDIVLDFPDYERVISKEISLRGCLGKTNRDYALALSWVTQGRLDLSMLPVEIFPLERFQDAWQTADRPAGPRVVIQIKDGA